MGGEQQPVIWDPHSPEFFSDPYPLLKRCREERPVHIGAHGAPVVFRYKDVAEMLVSPDYLTSELSAFLGEKEPLIFKKSTACPYLAKATSMWPLYLNDEMHNYTRAIMGTAINQLDLEPVIAAGVKETIRQFEGQDSFDLVDFAATYIFIILKALLGIDQIQELSKIKAYSNYVARVQDVYVPRQLYLEINDWMHWGKEIFAQSEYKDNLVKHAEKMGKTLSEDEIYSLMSITLMAAFETSKDSLSMTLIEMLKSESLLHYVQDADTANLNLAIEEFFRFSSPLQYTIRVNKQAIELEGLQIPADSKIYLSLASANRDPEVYEHPDTLIPDRKAAPHVSFGKGRHLCLGHRIARLEMRYCLQPMAEFLSQYKLDEQEPIQWARQVMMRTVSKAQVVSR